MIAEIGTADFADDIDGQLIVEENG